LVSPSGTARQLIEHYAQRWAIELFFTETKQLLGLGHYQTRSPQGVERHLQVVACAHLLLTHVRLNGATRAQAKSKPRAIARVSTAQAQTQLRYLVLCDLQQIAMRRARSTRALERFINLLLAA
jgi:SRSO17 transposase